MSHWANLNEFNKVTRVVRGKDDDPAGDEGYQMLVNAFGGKWVKTSYNAATNGFRKNFAGVGYEYSEELDAFVPPKPYPSWILNVEACRWQSPVPFPENENKVYTWDEEALEWIEVPSE